MKSMNNVIEFDLVAAFKGVTFIPVPFVIGHNNLNPKLVLNEKGIEYRNLFFMQQKAYSEIMEVGIFLNTFKILGVETTNVLLTFHQTVFTFAGNLNNDKKLRELLKRFKSQGCPLSREAQFLVAE